MTDTVRIFLVLLSATPVFLIHVVYPSLLPQSSANTWSMSFFFATAPQAYHFFQVSMCTFPSFDVLSLREFPHCLLSFLLTFFYVTKEFSQWRVSSLEIPHITGRAQHDHLSPLSPRYRLTPLRSTPGRRRARSLSTSRLKYPPFNPSKCLPAF